jgi:titin
LPRLEQVEPRCLLASFVVTNTMDDGSGSLRGAILQVNGDSSDDPSNPDQITFNIPQSDPGYDGATNTWTISPKSALNQITKPVFINGYSQPGSRANTNGPGQGDNAVLTIVLDGMNAGTSANGLLLGAGSSTIAGLVIDRFRANGIMILTSGTGDLIAGDIIGLNAAGTQFASNFGDGVQSDAGSTFIGAPGPVFRNIISGNAGNGISLGASAGGSVVQGNFLGTDVTGTDMSGTQRLAIGNGLNGVQSNAVIVIGGANPGAGNLISSNVGSGISLGALTGGSIVEGNYIGTDVTGNQGVGNGLDGVQSLGTTTIGGTASGARNVISSNLRDGISLGALAKSSLIAGNLIGLGANGATDLGNAGDGVNSSSSNNTIGGTATGAGNYIAGNVGDGITLTSITITVGNVVQGNFLGVSVAGATVGNLGNGIRIENSSANQIVGNTIAGNQGNGVEIDFRFAANNLVQGNRIGTDAGGTRSLGNHLDGIFINDAAATTIGGTNSGARNLISANGGSGIEITGPDALGNLAQGNFIGTNAAGTASLGNGANGITITDVRSTITTTTPPTPIQGNLISANAGAGIQLNGATTNVLVQGNLIGTDINGTVSLGTQQFGLFLSSSVGNTIGGMVAGQRNIISGNTSGGIQVFRSDNSGSNSIIENYIGTNFFGTSPLGNGTNGVGVFLNDNAAGAGDMVSGNVISGNGLAGVEITGRGDEPNANQVVSNKIGTDPNGARLMGMNALMTSSTTAPQQIGVLIQSSFGNTIGGPGSNGNVIEDNLVGVQISGINGNITGAPSANQVTANPTLVDRIIDNMLAGNLTGIYLNDTTDNLIEGNTITGNLSTGMTLLGTRTSGNLIQGNTITANIGTGNSLANPVGTGIYVEQAQNNTIQDNMILNNPVGLYLFDRALGNVATGNTLSKGGYGLFLFNSAGNAESLRTAKNKNSGNKIANFREFTGRPTARMGTQPPGMPSRLAAKGLVHHRHHHG